MEATILFVDDEPHVLEGLRRTLRNQNHTLYFARSGKEALEVLYHRPVDIIVADERMPGMTGTELLKTVRMEFPEIVRIVLTGHADMRTTISAINEGKIFGFLSKPIDRQKLLDTLEEALEWRREQKIRENMLQESVLACTWEWDITSNRLSWSDSFRQLFGTEPAHKNGDYKHLFSFVLGNDRPHLVQGIKEALENRESLELEHRTIINDHIRWVAQIIHVLTDRDTNPVKIIGIARDVTDRKKREKQLREALARSRSLLDKSLQAVAAVSEQRAPSAAGHQKKVAWICVQIAREMGLSQTEQETVYLAGLLHDIGKNKIPLEYLAAPGDLSQKETEIYKTHPRIGYEIIRDIPFPGPVARAVLEHHERLDGSGYPAGLTDEDICLEAKILAVADIYEAIHAQRPHHSDRGPNKAMDILTQNMDRLYHKQAVLALNKLHESGRLEMEGTPHIVCSENMFF
jgi:putative nucleotidyltransferase with HDIG domain/PAS domain S-box-containing protein